MISSFFCVRASYEEQNWLTLSDKTAFSIYRKIKLPCIFVINVKKKKESL